MAINREPRLVPPQNSTSRSLIVGTSDPLDTKRNVHGGMIQTKTGGKGSSDDDKSKPKILGSGSRHRRERVSAWEGTLPRLGFGLLDVTSLIDYETRPKTPIAFSLRPTVFPNRLPTPPYTPDDKPRGLSAGIASAWIVSADVYNSNGASSTATASVIRESSDSRNQSTLRSSPPAPLPASASRNSSDGKTQQSEQSDAVYSIQALIDDRGPKRSVTPIGYPSRRETLESTGHPRLLGGRTEAGSASIIGGKQIQNVRALVDDRIPKRSVTPIGYPSRQETLQGTGHPQLLGGRTEVGSVSIIGGKQIQNALPPPRSPNPITKTTPRPIRQRGITELESGDWTQHTSQGSPSRAPNHISTPRVADRYETSTNTSDPDRYLESIRAAVQATPRSREPVEQASALARANDGVQHVSALQTQVTTSKTLPVTVEENSTSQPGRVRPAHGQAHFVGSSPSSPGPSLEVQVHRLPTAFKARYIPKPRPALQFKGGAQITSSYRVEDFVVQTADNHLGRSCDTDMDDDDDDELGGCSIATARELPQIQAASSQEQPQFTRKTSSQAEKLIQDAFKAQVKEAAKFNAQFQTRPRLTKDQKFDSLIAKLQAKHLLQSGDATNQKEVHVFVDMSNIFIGFQDIAKISRGIHAAVRADWRPFSFEHLAFTLERGRTTATRKLAGSVRQAHQMHNLPLHIVEAQSYGYDTKILHQVIKLDPTRAIPNSPYTSGDEAYSGVLRSRTKLGEQGVDEALHLAMQDSILDAQGDPGIMVLATGDAKPAEYSDGFAHYAIKALKHGWHVEVVSWRKCLSGEWKKSPFKDKYAEQFRIILLDDFFDEIHGDWAGDTPGVLAWV
ncbi:putative NYN domain-containing protein [Seiridium cardinale]|uniref:NYN domain-containing protein n=1 Tax=Seiridium cardinale TaxID=138064 RepID=A0ABR2Y9D2_9PEZI